MADNKIGGFFVSLGMKIDQSFKAGEDAVSKFIGTVGKATAAAVGMAKIAGTVENSNLKMAKSIGISVQDLKAWQDAASKAGISGGALTSSMANLETKMQKLKLGEIDQGLAKNLGMLGIGYDQFAGMNANERMNSVFKAAGAMQDQAKAAVLVGDILGNAGREYYDWLSLSGSTLSKELSEAKALNFTTEESAKGAAAFNAEFNAIVNSTKSIGLLISSKIGEALTPVAKKVKDILAANKEFIASGIVGVVDVLGKIGRGLGDVLMNLTGADSIGEALGKIAEGVKKFAGPMIESAITLLKDLASAMHDLLTGDWDALGQSLLKFATDLRQAIAGQIGATEEASAANTNKGLEQLREGEILSGAGNILKGAAQAVFSEKSEMEKELEKLLPEGAAGFFKTLDLEELPVSTTKKLLGAVKDGSFNYLMSNDLSIKAKGALTAYKDKGVSDTVFLKAIYGDKLIEKTGSNKRFQDGILKPDGTTVQVAPDDWVFAARNLGDMASAFLPSGITNYTGGATEYSIVQEFTFNGTSRDMAHEVMRQAYKGTQSGLLEAMNRSTQRIQLMPGLR